MCFGRGIPQSLLLLSLDFNLFTHQKGLEKFLGTRERGRGQSSSHHFLCIQSIKSSTYTFFCRTKLLKHVTYLHIGYPFHSKYNGRYASYAILPSWESVHSDGMHLDAFVKQVQFPILVFPKHYCQDICHKFKVHI